MDTATPPRGIDSYLSTLRGGGPGRPGDPAAVDRVRLLLSDLGDPHLAHPVIHVTGTNGKGSTTTMIAGLLRSHGLAVGTYTSPHLERLAERVGLDDGPVDDDRLSAAVDRVAEAARGRDVTPTWFEAVTAAGLLLFGAADLDVVVMEVGMLGRLDATNVVRGGVSVVTNVELDHSRWAGPGRTAIAREKAGIVEPGATLILGEADPSLRGFFVARRPGRILTRGEELVAANRASGPRGSVLDLKTPTSVYRQATVGMAGEHQCDNALLAVAAAEAHLGRPLEIGAVRQALSSARAPCRLEIVGDKPTVILDVAHNEAGGRALRRATQEIFGAVERKVLLVGMTAGRDPSDFLLSLGVGPGSKVFATEPRSGSVITASALAIAARRLGAEATAVRDVAAAEHLAVKHAGADGMVIATGSHYLVADVRNASS
jgi:dihydrofolate synthase/folylpolyglutamate synthase